ncbi:hypothetical protein BU26DRAFT_524071 [Trematosphaeria pertusa]|uniref:Uncharacterized protein n=1 Tax=Trematosphaeria pertusa TaxID=390896 RepID=A0A6A6HYY3_9PLEO|nr:uncharacterized protein BU26DRAFT_524071 [Trematosphaeria pertusa]KAF2243109.1 hypothetical protein BU26DRAFT_524071 [Trematosphaeria pertusa]
MALRRQNLSPTANLLRNSRLFSLPNPLPRPNVAETYGAGVQKVSDTATLPFPTHQAIATTPSSLARGDWGLKRPLPSRSHLVQTSNPVVRVKQLDTIEHVTDFDSAADHVRTRQKWEELGIPMMKGMAAMRETGVGNIQPGGAFEHRSDVTSYEGDEGLDEAGLILETVKQSVKANIQEEAKAAVARRRDPNAPPASFIPYSLPHPDPARHNARRWKHDGPWLPGMSADEFTTYVTKELTARRKEFNQYLVQYVKNEIYTIRQNSSRNSGMALEEAEAEEQRAAQEKQWANITSADINAGIKALRREAAVDPLASKLVQRLIIPFLRLPNIKFKNTAFHMDSTKNEIEQYRFDDDRAPLSTHPSAGLGYLRTNAYLSNHPILGPQGERTPVSARVVQPLETNSSTEKYARLGVAGFVANDDYSNTGSSARPFYHRPNDVQFIDVHTEGGAKVNVHPRYASVTNDGRIHIKLDRATGSEIKVARGELEDRPPAREKVEQDPMADLTSGMGKSGIKELDEQSSQAQDLANMLHDLAQQGGGSRGLGEVRPGVEEAARGEGDARS